jgi:1-acyl-sn-glycerol-3-phosphate acyltransferase
VVAVALSFPLADLIQRTVVAGLVRIFPSRRDRLLTKWIRGMAQFSLVRLVQGLGGAKVALPPELESEPRTLMLMNHQSLLDIPLAILSLRDSYPLIVTRRRYARGIPLVSHMLRLYDFPLVDPTERGSEQLAMLDRLGREARRPVLIFPEGHRTRDGQLRAFRPSGTTTLLETGPWTVHALVVDGFWRCGELRHFSDEIGLVRSRITRLGPFPFDPATQDAREFLTTMHDRMRDALAAMREEGPDD